MLRKLFAVAALCLASLAFAPVAMASPPTDFCVLDLAPAIPIDHGVNLAPAECPAVVAAVETIVLRMPGGDEDIAAGPSMNHKRMLPAFDLGRQHFDPGRAGI